MPQAAAVALDPAVPGKSEPARQAMPMMPAWPLTGSLADAPGIYVLQH